VIIDTLNNGVFQGSLEVEDTLGAVHQQRFQVTITDIDPVANAGGPYIADQGIEITFDASRSRSLNPEADAITGYRWDWNDGSEPTVVDANTSIVRYTFSSQGAYNVTLSVLDEDSSTDVIVGVVIADVDPQIDDIYVHQVQGELNQDRPDPVVAFEMLPIEFGVNATPGDPNDPITMYQWDFDGDLLYEETTDVPSVEWQFMDPGIYQVSVLVRDRDSFTLHTQSVEIKPVSFEDIFHFIAYSVNVKIQNGGLDFLSRARLANTASDAEKGIWAQMYDGVDDDPVEELANGALADRSSRIHLQHQGISLVAAQRVLSDLIQVQARGVDFGNEIWAISRQMKREVGYDLEAIDQAAQEGIYADRAGDIVYINRMAKANERMTNANSLYESEEFEPDARDLNQPQGLPLTLQYEAQRSTDWASIAVDQCTHPAFDHFAVYVNGQEARFENVTNTPEFFNEAEVVRANSYSALSSMLDEIESYIDRGGNNDPAPGRAELQNAATSLRTMLERAEYRIDYQVCDSDQGDLCANSRSTLEIELIAMDLINQLQSAAVAGAYVMNWQSCLVEYLRFRIEASLVAIKDQCGRFYPRYLKAAEVFEEGRSLLENENDENGNSVINALNFYTETAQKCLIVDIYNECLVRRDPRIMGMTYPYPEACLEK
jgi:hypothetical protein